MGQIGKFRQNYIFYRNEICSKLHFTGSATSIFDFKISFSKSPSGFEHWYWRNELVISLELCGILTFCKKRQNHSILFYKISSTMFLNLDRPMLNLDWGHFWDAMKGFESDAEHVLIWPPVWVWKPPLFYNLLIF